jgi:hypothetical protein
MGQGNELQVTAVKRASVSEKIVSGFFSNAPRGIAFWKALQNCKFLHRSGIHRESRDLLNVLI